MPTHRSAIDELAVTTDLIVGFPGETDDDAERTLEVVAEAQFDSAYTFIFSPRPGTRAAAMTDRFVPPEVVAERFERLKVVLERSALTRHEERVGRDEEILVEGASKRDPEVFSGRTRQGKLVHFEIPPSGRPTPGSYARARVTGAAPHFLRGEFLELTAPSRHRARIPVRSCLSRSPRSPDLPVSPISRSLRSVLVGLQDLLSLRAFRSIHSSNSVQEGPLPHGDGSGTACVSGGHLAFVGPTASGKTSLALDLASPARCRDRERRLDGGVPRDGHRHCEAVGRPARRRPVHMIDLVEPSCDYTVREFQDAGASGHRRHRRKGSASAARRRHRPVPAAVVDDLRLPGRWPEVAAALDTAEARASSRARNLCSRTRNLCSRARGCFTRARGCFSQAMGRLRDRRRRHCTQVLHARLKTLDPVAAGRIDPSNRRRLLRALEVTHGSGLPFSSFGPGLGTYPHSSFVQVGIPYEQSSHDEKVTSRFAALLEEGLLDEVRTLAARPGGLSRTASQAIGYGEMLDHLENGTPFDDALLRRACRGREPLLAGNGRGSAVIPGSSGSIPAGPARTASRYRWDVCREPSGRAPGGRTAGRRAPVGAPRWETEPVAGTIQLTKHHGSGNDFPRAAGAAGRDVARSRRGGGSVRPPEGVRSRRADRGSGPAMTERNCRCN